MLDTTERQNKMKDKYFSEHWLDEKQKPAGGVSTGKGVTISWQNGPLGRGEGRKEPNGAFVETVIDMVIDRIKFYNDAGFDCEENYSACGYLKSALVALERRTATRESAGVEGTHERRPQPDDQCDNKKE